LTLRNPSIGESVEQLIAENEVLRLRLDEAEQTLSAIRDGAVDALVVKGPTGDNVFTLAGSDHNYRLLIESIDEGALTATHDGTILYCNSKFAEMVDQPVQTIVGKRLVDFVDPAEKPGFEKFLKGGGSISRTGEVTLVGKDGHGLSTKVSIARLDVEGVSGISVIVTDLTQTKMAASLLSANSELSRSNAELANYAFVASHDLKEPLRVISNYVQLLETHLKDRFDGEAVQYRKFILNAVQRMFALIDDLLNYSKIDADTKELTDVDCGEVVADVLSNLEMSLKECGGEVVCGSLPRVKGNRAELVQLFQNLLENAVKYRGNRPPKITIQAQSRSGNWVFSIQDNGIGIEDQYFDKIFLLFQRLHGHQNYSGTGIGLAICKKVVERHGGKIWLESTLNKGTTFFFSIPA
jgi:PAS domain S-box-containing protein